MKFYILAVATILVVSAFVQPGDSRIPDDEVKGSKHSNNRFHSPIEIRKRQMLREEFLSKMYGNEKPSFFGRPFGRGSGRDNFGQKQRFDRMGQNGGSSMDELFRYPPSPGSRRYQQRRPVMYPRELGPKPPQLFLEEIIIIRRIPVVLAKILGIKTDDRPGSGKFPRRPGSPGPLGPIPFPPPQPLAPGPPASRPPPPPPSQGNRNPVPEIEEIYPADQATKGQPLLPPQQSSKKPTDNLDSTTKDVDLETWEDEEEEEEITPVAAFKDNGKNAGADKAESESDSEKEEESLEPVARSSSLDSDKQMNQSKDHGSNIKQEVKELKVKNNNDNKRQETENDETENEI